MNRIRYYICLLLCLLLIGNIAFAQNEWVNVSHSRGVPLGGLGCGYSMFGKYGFVKVNFNGRPDEIKYNPNKQEDWSYIFPPVEKDYAPFGFFLSDGVKSYVFQKEAALWKPEAEPFDTIEAYAFLPKSKFKLQSKRAGVNVFIEAFTPLIQHDLLTSTTPVQVFDVTVRNLSAENKNLTLRLEHARSGVANGNKFVVSDIAGHIAFAVVNGKVVGNGVEIRLNIPAKGEQTTRFFLSWYYPAFKNIAPDTRYYAKVYKSAVEVIDTAIESADKWLSRIEQWQNSYDVPVYLKRLWFSSLSSVITSTMLGAGPSFYEIETPHPFLNTMDVVCYSSWVYMINWPEIERLDMEQYASIIDRKGKNAGFVWHSMIKDKSDYVEEPCYLTRMYRDYLWYNDKAWLQKQYPFAVLAANRVYKSDGLGYLINSDHGNQSYDLWKMPGISSYVNVAWIYGLHGLESMSKAINSSVLVKNIPVTVLKNKAVQSFDSLLWNPAPGYWNCFYRTSTAKKMGEPATIFSDQLFGKWMLGIDPKADVVLPEYKVKQALKTIYSHNLIEDKEKSFRGWANGLKPGRIIDSSGDHAYMFWFGAQFDLASLLASIGEENASLDIMKSVEFSLKNNLLAAGEWNQSFDKDLKTMTMPKEPAKDSPRFPAYPRYKSGWEFLIRLLGLQMDEKNFYLTPFKSVDFAVKDLLLAGANFTISVQAGWNKVKVNGVEVLEPVVIDRSIGVYKIEFLK